ncbi:DUF3592 domain-containing protein [Spirillospora sp. CA-128828]|uniref:DUF3592 domain-containing protein n=1 Tax=Spirillospora sp. CA-128828 TaxID=3240033 RepID=UPI003D92F0D1
MSSWLLALLAIAFGVAFVLGGIHRYRTSRAFMATAHRVPGIVAGIHRVSTTDSYEFFPVLRFRTLDGTDIETVGETRGGSFELTRLKGRPVPVLYDPQDPRKARMDTSSGRALAGSAGMAAAGCVFALIGIVMLIATAT